MLRRAEIPLWSVKPCGMPSCGPKRLGFLSTMTVAREHRVASLGANGMLVLGYRGTVLPWWWAEQTR